MTIEEFKEEVQDAVDLDLTDYFKPEIEWDFEDPEEPRAYITIKVRPEEKPYILTIKLNDGQPEVQAGEESYCTLDAAGFMTVMFFEAHKRLVNPNH